MISFHILHISKLRSRKVSCSKSKSHSIKEPEFKTKQSFAKINVLYHHTLHSQTENQGTPEHHSEFTEASRDVIKCCRATHWCSTPVSYCMDYYFEVVLLQHFITLLAFNIMSLLELSFQWLWFTKTKCCVKISVE